MYHILPSGTPSAPTTTSKWLNMLSTASVSRKPVTVAVKNAEDAETSLARPIAASVGASVVPSPTWLGHGSPGTSNRRPTSVLIESEDQRKQRLAEEKEKERQAEEKVRKEKELAARKGKEEEERGKREEEEKRRLRQEAEEKEWRRNEEKRREEEEARRNGEAKARKEGEGRLQREKEAKEKQERERLERERAEKERAEHAEAEWLRLEQREAERKTATEAQVDARPGKEDGEIDEDDTSPAATQYGKDKVKENLRISTNYPGNLDLTDAKKTNIPAPQSALATARVISDINAVTYPEGVSSPNPALNQNAKEGKFRYVNVFVLQDCF